MKPFELSATGIAEAVNAGDLDPRAVAQFYADRTESLASTLNTHIYWDKAETLKGCDEQIAKIQNARKKGEHLPLAGVPIVVKDNICVQGIPTTAASKILKGFKPVYNATVIERLLDAGAFLFGKANLDEFAMGSSNENSAFGNVKNPWNQACVPGGSSGGSAAVVSADLSPIALGSDTGGSVRQPASFCGVVGLKPTYGRISRYGLIAFGSSLDQIGPLTRTVKDTALVYDVMSGHDAKDSTSLKLPRESTLQTLEKLNVKDGLKGLRIGVVKELSGQGLEPGVAKAFSEAVKLLKEKGALVTEVSLPHIEYSIATYYIIATAEASSNLARFDGVRYGMRNVDGKSLQELYVNTRSQGFGKEVKQRIILGTFVLSSGHYDAYYSKATLARELIRKDFSNAFGQVDLLVSPTSPTTAFEFGKKSGDSLAMYLSDICTIAANLSGVPAVSVPCGFDDKALPVGLQFMAPHQHEETLLKGAYLYEQASEWFKQHPKC